MQKVLSTAVFQVSETPQSKRGKKNKAITSSLVASGLDTIKSQADAEPALIQMVEQLHVKVKSLQGDCFQLQKTNLEKEQLIEQIEEEC